MKQNSVIICPKTLVLCFQAVCTPLQRRKHANSVKPKYIHEQYGCYPCICLAGLCESICKSSFSSIRLGNDNPVAFIVPVHITSNPFLSLWHICIINHIRFGIS